MDKQQNPSFYEDELAKANKKRILGNDSLYDSVGGMGDNKLYELPMQRIYVLQNLYTMSDMETI